jgi:hypothetical protein
MMLVRLALLTVIGLLLLCTVVIGLGTGQTGVVEKAVLVAFGLLLVLAAAKVHRLGSKAA